LAEAKLARETPGQTLQATALVHEAYLRLVGDAAKEPGEACHASMKWDNRGHFFAAAAEAMRRILVENARRKNRTKHGGNLDRVEVELADLPCRIATGELITLDEALQKLQQQDPLKARLVTLRFFGGLTIEQASEVLGISRVSAYRYWTFARAWLHHEINGGRPRPPDSA
jgi:RNA polymerase sigma factor (TIGR02999 family)